MLELDFGDIIVRTALAFVLMLLAARVLGKQMIAHMTYFNFVANITLGSLTGAIVLDHHITLMDLVLAIAVFTIITFIASFLSLKNKLIGKWIAGHSVELIRDGKILEKELRESRLTVDSVKQQLRLKNVFDIHTVQQAFLETDGKLSILLKPENRPLTVDDFEKRMTPKQLVPLELIVDGQVIEENLTIRNLDRNWLASELKKQGTADVKDIVYAVLSSKQRLHVINHQAPLVELPMSSCNP